jgi:RNA polymerase sigma-70 factor (ECF subfamily)
LIARATVLRDSGSFGVLVSRHQSRVRGYLRHLCGDYSVADDLAQETFIRAWDRLTSFRGRGAFTSWLLSIAHNTFLQSARKSGRERRLKAEFEQRREAGEVGGLSSPPVDEGDLLDLPRLLEPLSAEERSVIVLGYGYGYSHAEIARVTGMPVGTVKSHVRRGKLRIREIFRIEGGDDG